MLLWYELSSRVSNLAFLVCLGSGMDTMGSGSGSGMDTMGSGSGMDTTGSGTDVMGWGIGL